MDELLEILARLPSSPTLRKIHLELPVRLRPKARPRRTQKGWKVWWYTPSGRNEEEIGMLAAKQMREKGLERLGGKVKLSATIYLKGKVNGDISNLIKALEDALEGVCYYNDIQIREYGEIKVMNEAKDNLVIVDLEEIGRFERKKNE